MKTALIVDNIVTVVSFVEPPSDEWIEVPDHVLPGYRRLPDDIFEAPPVEPPTIADVRGEAGRRAEALVAEYLVCERETWPVQIQEAEAYLVDQTAATPFLTPRAAGRGVTVAELATTVIAKRDALAAATGAIYGAMDVLLAMDPIPADFADDSHWP
ncbi:hypothetical protein GTA62_14800 [Roseobacter sp. HKCCD9010]|uniref:hypothetical protein n=1 Tax=unclassified Roseobacter TaxID=196798 RepID=UPI0014921C62|nr:MULTISPECIES: hypothetical protein [unclassified Roseobacter]MBF9050620.1 hypothetical protein [Rhodobacterales bacterium HKCCD4356]NNV11962.1 hypothetical protein [Roseobacter sp. HKCCD7357]NNV16975.1 hypothetical protein [Roseobacter sp. HKCCD8768]NNV26204.1 hypothetical protein [Roseobacter sp. HKCCD8192]NNV30699.1 hypothetical protein [Roseobacter sp. HKCCD9061]